MDEMGAWFSYPAAVQMRVPTEEELKKFEEKKIEKEKKHYLGLIAIAEGNGKKVKEVSQKEFFLKYGYE